MTAPFVRFPGTPGVNMQTPDANKIDADSCHLQQSVGGWKAVSEYVSAPAQSQDLTPRIGAYVGKAVTTGATDNAIVQCNPDVLVPVTAGEVISHGIWLQGIGGAGGMEVRTLQTFHTAAGGWVGQVIPGVYVVISSGAWVWYKGENIVVPATAEATRIRLEWRQIDNTPPEDGDAIYFDGYTLVDGATAPDDLIPSLNVVGTLFEDKDPAGMPVGYAADGTPLTVGDGWAGDGYHYRRYDGADATGPLVAEFDATQVPV